MKILKEILYKVSTEGVFGSTLVKISSLSFDSRNIKKNSLYVAKKGIHQDGHDFIKKSIEKGAAAIVCNKLPEEVIDGITYIIVNNTSKALGILASNFYDNPSEKLNLVGITGTNGKTSVAFFLHQLFSSHSLKCGLLSTIKIKYLDREFNNSSTTPDIITINNLLNDMVKEGVDFCFMEVSSHGIAQDRIYGLSFKAGVFTNLTHDHLDYHGNFKNYRDTKKQFFDNLSDSAFALTNIDDKNGSFMLQNTKAKKYTYATKFHADYMVKILECEFSGMLLKIQNHEVWSSLIGHFNSQNLLAVYAIADLFKIPTLNILKYISQLRSADGRFQSFQTKDKITIVVDYAHTPDALKNILETINNIRTNNEILYLILGCGGNRDKQKRPLMGKIATDLCDKVIFTSDNPRDEDPLKIISEMIAGVESENYKKFIKVTLREEAIAMAGQLSKKGDIVVIAGKGHERYQEINGKRYPFNDTEVAHKIFLNTD